MLNLAVGEAAAIAWQTGFPHLLFPALADEKIDAVNRWARKQDRIRQQGLRARLAAQAFLPMRKPSNITVQ